MHNMLVNGGGSGGGSAGSGLVCAALRRTARQTMQAGGPSRCSLTPTMQVRRSHIGKAPLYLAQGTKLDVLPFAPVGDPLKRQPKALQKARSISIQGPRGTVIIPLHECVRMKWQEEEAEATAAATAADEEFRKLSLSVTDATEAKQRALWGLTRALLANAIEGVQEGHSRILRLVGVGYRAVVEDDPFPRPDKFERAYAEIAEKSLDSTASNATRLGYFSSEQQRDYYKGLFDITVSAPTVDEATGVAAPPKVTNNLTRRLSLRLGYSHPIYMTIPRGITCTTPQPTRILLQGANQEALGLFASQIRAWRPPEPYKGKGVFVDDETIKIKAPRKK